MGYIRDRPIEIDTTINPPNIDAIIDDDFKEVEVGEEIKQSNSKLQNPFLQETIKAVDNDESCVEKLEMIKMPIDYISNSIYKLQVQNNFKNTSEAERFCFNPSQKQNKRVYGNYSLETLVVATNDLTTLKENLNKYDKLVCIIIAAYAMCGIYCTTPSMILSVMAGENKKHYKTTQNQIDAIVNSVDKLMRTIITIDADKIAKYLGYDEGFNYKEPLLPVQVQIPRDRNFGKEPIFFYYSKLPPINFRYAALSNQIQTHPIERLKSPLSINEENKNIQMRLIERIDMIKGKNNIKNDVIVMKELLIDSKCIEEGQDPYKDLNRKQRSSIYKKIEKILNAWTEQGYIHGYEWIGPNKKYTHKKLRIEP